MTAVDTLSDTDIGGIIDCDAHITEPPDLWSSRVPAALKDKIPVQKTVDDTTYWSLNGKPWASIGGNTIAAGLRKVVGSHILQPFDNLDPAAYDVKARLALCDEIGVAAQILYPNGIGFASNHMFAIEDPEQRTQVLKLYNDYLMDVQDESGGRLMGQGILPVWDMDLTVSEMTRLLDRGMRGFTLSDKPELLGLPGLYDDYFEPMWRIFNDTGAVANFHIGAGGKMGTKLAPARRLASGVLDSDRFTQDDEPGTSTAGVQFAWDCFGTQRKLVVGMCQAYTSNLRMIVNLCLSNFFDRYPSLKIASIESGIGWVPFMLEQMEYEFDEMITEPEEVAHAKLRPTEYFREHIYVTFWFEKSAPKKLIEDIGIKNVLVETDFPHPVCLYPGAKEHFTQVLGALDPAIRSRVLRDNAAELYRVEL